MPTHEKHDTHQKALSLNLDVSIFGSFRGNRCGTRGGSLVSACGRCLRHGSENDLGL